jgi:hypothetical protein
MKTELSKAMEKMLSETRRTTNGYEFKCWCEVTVDIKKEITEAKTHCHTYEVWCDQYKKDSAIIISVGANEDQNKMDIECVRSYLLNHGWQEEMEHQP